MSSSKKIDMYRDFAAGVYLSEALFPPMTAHPPTPPQHTVYVYTVHLFTQGRGEEELTKEKVRGATVHKPGSKKLS